MSSSGKGVAEVSNSLDLRVAKSPPSLVVSHAKFDKMCLNITHLVKKLKPLLAQANKSATMEEPPSVSTVTANNVSPASGPSHPVTGSAPTTALQPLWVLV